MRIVAMTAFAALAALAGCAERTTQTSPQTQTSGSPTTDRSAPAAQVSSAGSSGEVLLWVEGFGCPMCATNLEYELEEIAGVMDATIDLERGTASVLLAKGESPSASQYRRAAEDSGLSLTRIEGPGFTR